MTMVLNGTSGVTTNSGTLISATTIGVGGTTPSASGAGITFPATQSASSDVNTLDDYEEGTWTPVLTRTGQTITQSGSGSYVKVGRLITVTAYITVSSVSGTGSGYLTVTGAPFVASQPSGTNFGMCGAMMYNNACATDSRCAEIQSSIIYFMPLGSTATEIQADAKAGSFAFQITYMTA